MTPEELQGLAGGHAPGNLTPEEKRKLYTAALEDQQLFDALMEEEALRDVLSDPESRGYVQAALDERSEAEAFAMRPSLSMRKAAPISPALPAAPMARKPFPYWMMAAACMAVIAGGSIVWRLSQPAEGPATPVAVNQPPPKPTPKVEEVVKERSRKPLDAPRRVAERPAMKRIEKREASPEPAEASLDRAEPRRERKDEEAKTVVAEARQSAAAPAPSSPPVTAPPPASPPASASEMASSFRAEIEVTVYRAQADGKPGDAPATGPFRGGEKIVLRIKGNIRANQAVVVGTARFPLRQAGDKWEAGPIDLMKGAFAASLVPAPEGRMVFGIRSSPRDISAPGSNVGVAVAPIPLIQFTVE